MTDVIDYKTGGGGGILPPPPKKGDSGSDPLPPPPPKTGGGTGTGGSQPVGPGAIRIYPPGEATPLAQYLMLEAVDPLITVVSFDGTKTFHISGGLAPVPGVQDGIVLQSAQGFHPPFKHLDSQGARQDGTTWNDTVYEPAEFDWTLEAVASPASGAAGLSQVVRDWIATWDPKLPATINYFTPELGTWWCNARLLKAWTDPLKKSPRRFRSMPITHAARNDNAFWRSVDSVSRFEGNGGGNVALTNIGDQDGWARFLCYGPGTFSFGNGPNSSQMVTFGPLLPGQIVQITTEPRLRAVVDLSPNAPTQTSNELQSLIQFLVNLVSFNQVPPLLQWVESLFGIRAPQGVLYSLLNGRFSNPIPGCGQPSDAQTTYTNVGISGGDSNSKIIAALTPLRRWPE